MNREVKQKTNKKKKPFSGGGGGKQGFFYSFQHKPKTNQKQTTKTTKEDLRVR